MHPAYASRRALRAVALWEAAKGAVVLLAGFGLLSLLDRDVEEAAQALIAGLHIDPARRWPSIFLRAAAKVSDAQLWGLAALALAYAALRAAEAYGLWLERRWAAWLGAASGAIYVPVEIYELARRASALKVATLLVNLAIVVYLLWMLRRAHAPRALL